MGSSSIELEPSLRVRLGSPQRRKLRLRREGYYCLSHSRMQMKLKNTERR
jgi:hypothetical protein